MAEVIDVGFEAKVTVQVTDKMIQQFAELSGDHNPIHLSDEYASKTRFGRRIAHGMIVGALISRALVDGIGQGGIYLAQNMKFVNPVFVDDTIVITIKITGLRKEKGIATVETNVAKVNGDVVVKGDAVIMMSSTGPSGI
ncbi:MaoC family dehydratase [Bdellovibrio bacteriovorus]|uniref:MaoC family dehydratase n=1 Tax=Bdellovibrio bacteriovorus TaxID=959 RepID=UPI0021D2D601|nr:MaoC family dehydratase [Bdellovibrio bacteriovorus]UXR64735.1 MaoC family dehydratase [Bdellovibrio bacteriovorus]